MRPAFSYYGGKQRMASKIVPLIPKHTVYVEPFAGGAAVFFAKPWPEVTNNQHYREVLNDKDSRIVNFYRIMREQPTELIRRVSLTCKSREEHMLARDDSDCEIENARRWFVDIQQGFANRSRSGWNTGVFSNNHAATWTASCARLWECASRLSSVYIEHDDALNVIERWDSPQTFFYCDPPYPGSDQGHYSGYSHQDLMTLVDALDSCQGSFILSNYAQDYIPNHWERFEWSAIASASGKGNIGKGRDKSMAQTEHSATKRRTEVAWRVVRGGNVRPEIAKLYEQGKFDCFTGGDEAKSRTEGQ